MNTCFVLAVCWRKLSENFSNFSKVQGVPDGGGLSDTFFSIGSFCGKISNYFKLFQDTFLCIGNRGKLSQIFSKVFPLLIFPQKCFYLSQVECRLVGGSISGGYAGIHV